MKKLILVVVACLVVGLAAGGTVFFVTRPSKNNHHITPPGKKDTANFLRLVAKKDQAIYDVNFHLDRQITGRDSLTGTTEQLQDGNTNFTNSFDSVTGFLNGKAFSCSSGAGGPLCTFPNTQPPDPEAKLLQALLTKRFYKLSDVETATIAGEKAQCFGLRRQAGSPFDTYGDIARLCYASDGVPLATTRTTFDGTDTLTATKVNRKVTAVTIASSLSPFRTQLHL